MRDVRPICSITCEGGGTQARGNATAVTKPGTGHYLITFTPNVSTCGYVATVESPTAQATFSDTRIGFAEAVPGPATNQVRVFTTDKGGSQADRGFTVAVHC